MRSAIHEGKLISFQAFPQGHAHSGIVSPTMELFAAFGIASVVWYGGSSVIAGTRTPGDFFAFMTAMFLMYQPFKSLTRTYTMLHQGLAGAERVFEILAEAPSIADKPGARAAAPFAAGHEFHDVSFAYGMTRCSVMSI